MSQTLLRLEDIQKKFGGVTSLNRSSLDVSPGEVHLLMGENGAGKSSLMKIVAGMLPADRGRMFWKGNPVQFRHPAEAAAAGISMVHQESLLAEHLTVAENIFLGREPSAGFGWVRRRSIEEHARRIIAEYGFPLQAHWRVASLSPARKQMVEICRAAAAGSSLLIFDEPTSALSTEETGHVLKIVARMRERGAAVVYITHRMEELRAIGDRVTVLRDGATVHTGPLAAITADALIGHMVGRSLDTSYRREPLPPGNAVLEVSGLSSRFVHDIDFKLHAREIVGVAGLVGSGRTELCQAIFGVDPSTRGVIRVDGLERSIRSPRDAVRAGIALLTEDRRQSGLALDLPVTYNVTLADVPAVSPRGFLRRSWEKQSAEESVARLRIRCGSVHARATTLSGGNQQKVVLAKWLFRRARVFLFDEPTRGIDVGAKREILGLIDELLREGAAILMVSSELVELLGVADRMLVMHGGRIAGELPRGATQESVLRLARGEQAA